MRLTIPRLFDLCCAVSCMCCMRFCACFFMSVSFFPPLRVLDLLEQFQVVEEMRAKECLEVNVIQQRKTHAVRFVYSVLFCLCVGIDCCGRGITRPPRSVPPGCA